MCWSPAASRSKGGPARSWPTRASRGRTWATEEGRLERFLQDIVNGIADGSIYGAVALALVLIFRSTGIVNFAQGEMAMFTTFIAWGLTQAGLGVWPAVLITMGLAFVGGMLIERVLVRPVE